MHSTPPNHFLTQTIQGADSLSTTLSPTSFHTSSTITTTTPEKLLYGSTSSLSAYCLSLSNPMEEEQLSHGRGGGDNTASLLRHSAIATTFSLPLARYTSRLISGDHNPILLGDYPDSRSEEGDRTTGENCACSKPIVVLDLLWNLAFVVVSVVVLLSTVRERPSTPLRVWLSGYALQCLMRVGFGFLEYLTLNQSDVHDDEDDVYGIEDQLPVVHNHIHNDSRTMKRLETVNTAMSSIWWVLGFYWLVLGGQALQQDSPSLYWLTVVFLAFDVFYIVFCTAMACIICIAVLFCIPVVTIAYAVRIKEGASEDEIRALPRYRFCHGSSRDIFGKSKDLGARAESGISKSANELALPPEDSECCICLTHYVDGAELYSLPCSHHFHCGCISTWLRVNASCPLCKFNILRADSQV